VVVVVAEVPVFQGGCWSWVEIIGGSTTGGVVVKVVFVRGGVVKPAEICHESRLTRHCNFITISL